MKFVLVAAAMTLCLACGTKRNEERCLEGLCSDPDLPFCDIDGTIGGTPNACVAVDCTPGEFASCRGDRALTCNTTGDNYDLVQCANGCDANGCKPCTTPECEKHIIPKYLPTICDTISEGSVSFTSQTLDTTNALNCHSVVTQLDGPDICVYRASEIIVPANQTLRVEGTRAFAMVADRKLDIVGIVDVSGPGPGAVETSGLPGNVSDGSGSGGAGFKTAGGAGGNKTANGGAANGGAATTNPALLTYLVAGKSSPKTGGIGGGHGAGGLTLISCRGTVSVSGLIDANGGGGGSGYHVGSTHFPAGGGGSGGNVAMQGMNIEITGQLFANGGGGGAGEDGAELTNGYGNPGAKGPRAVAYAAGGAGATFGGSGGNGGGFTLLGNELTEYLPGQGGLGSQFGGGGGGSLGFLQTYTPEAVNPKLMPTAASPPLGANRPIPTN